MPVYPSAEAEYILQTSRGEVAQVLQDHVNNLSGAQTKIVYQKFYLGLTYEEIARINDISVKTAYNTIYKSVEKLRKLIGPEYTEVLFYGSFTLYASFSDYFQKSVGKITTRLLYCPKHAVNAG